MSQLLIQKYLNDLSDLRRVSGSQRESVVREAFKTLLKKWGRSEGLLFVPEYEHRTAMDERRYVDGALVEPQIRLPRGYWEAKDTDDDLDAEIVKKFRKGLPAGQHHLRRFGNGKDAEGPDHPREVQHLPLRRS
jgi:hypothetical protein